VLTPYEGNERPEHRARFRRWVRCGERFDYAWVDLIPEIGIEGFGIREGVSAAVIGPRHEQVFLDAEDQQWPVHVYVLSPPDELADSDFLPSDAMKIRAWALLLRPLDAVESSDGHS
jgi:hypothetical protein